MSNSFNGVRLDSDHDDDHDEDDSRHHLDDHEDDGSKEHTRLLQQDSSSSANKLDRGINRRNGNRSMVHSLYATPKHSVSQRRQASVPGTPIHDEHDNSRGAAPLFMNNVAGLWDNETIKDHQDTVVDGGRDSSSIIGVIHRRGSARTSAANSRPSSSLILDDATPPLPWKGPTDQFGSPDRLSVSQRFSMDAIADGGAFAMPSSQPSLSDSQSLPPSTFTEPQSIESSPKVTPVSTPAAEPKKRRWGPKSQKAAAVEPVVPEEESMKEFAIAVVAASEEGTPSTEDTPESLFSPQSYDSHSTAAVTIPSAPNSGRSTPMQNKVSQTGASSTFGLSALSGTGRGLVSGLTSLKNSIMIPALSTSVGTAPNNGNSNRNDRNPELMTGSQSSLLEFLEDPSSHPSFVQQRHHTTHRHSQQQTSSRSSSAASSVTGSPGLFRSMFLRSGNETEYFSGKNADGTSSMFLERMKPSANGPHHDRSRKESHHHSARQSTFGLYAETKGTSLHQQQQPPFQRQPRRKRVASQTTGSATGQSLSTHELELQQQIQRQSQLSMRKVELGKELLSLYSRRNSSEQRQEDAVKAERFEEADAATVAIVQVQERISQLEGIYADTDRALWECKKRQDDLGRKICEFHPIVLREMDEMRVKRETERDQFEVDLKERRETEVGVLQRERDEIEKDRSDIALEQDFLGKNQSELKERIDDETRIDQDELDDLKEKRRANRTEIEELTKKLEELNQQDKAWALEIATVQQRIRTTEEQFGEKSKEVMHDKQNLDQRISDLQKRSQRLDRQEALLQRAVEEGEVVQGKLQGDIQAIVLQQEHLESVRKMFGDALATIQKLRVEEESFREKEAGWSMRSSRWAQDLVQLENRIKKLTDRVTRDQKAFEVFGESIEDTERRVNQAESLKVLAVQRRDFKQASHYSGELARLREMLDRQRQDLVRHTKEMASDSTQKDLAGLQKEYDELKGKQRQEQLELFKEIQKVTAETLGRLAAAYSRPTSNGSSAAADKSKDAADKDNTAAGVLLSELNSEIESVLEVSRIRFGRETTVPSTTDADGATAAAAVTMIATTKGEDVAGKEEQRAALERDIQAAVVEEDYTTAAELQEKLEKLA
ncbi:hypothetical protein BGZ95_010118 [Linnemannia exigua]|uniref:UVR domain-containing protein n=1 Tax=Linnemannia exigua TaxID=604196 RepID=A0AAD4DBW2_9FUNG|nr:hypothetical protein BGZ95_010118 [Linnemannia exigua]